MKKVKRLLRVSSCIYFDALSAVLSLGLTDDQEVAREMVVKDRSLNYGVGIYQDGDGRAVLDIVEEMRRERIPPPTRAIEGDVDKLVAEEPLPVLVFQPDLGEKK